MFKNIKFILKYIHLYSVFEVNSCYITKRVKTRTTIYKLTRLIQINSYHEVSDEAEKYPLLTTTILKNELSNHIFHQFEQI